MFSDWSGIAKRSNSLSFIIIGTANKTNIIWQSIVIPFVITSWHGNAFLTLCPANTQRNKHLVITSKRCFDVIITCLLRFMFVGSTHCETKAPVTGGFPYEGHDMELCCFICCVFGNHVAVQLLVNWDVVGPMPCHCEVHADLCQQWVRLWHDLPSQNIYLLKMFSRNTPDSKVYWANMGPTWVLSAPGGPHVGPMNLAIRDRMARPWAIHGVSCEFNMGSQFQLRHFTVIWSVVM